MLLAAHHATEQDSLQGVMRAFFARDSIIVTVLSNVQQRNEHDDDPFSDVMIMLISHPLCVCINECGFTPFRQDPTVIVPFHAMTPASSSSSTR